MFNGFAKLMSNSVPSFWLMFYLLKGSRLLREQMHRIKGVDQEMSGKFDFLLKYASFLSAGREINQEIIFDNLQKNKAYATDTRFVVLTMDFDFMGAGKARCNYMTQLAQVVKLKKKYPDKLLPFIAIDPRRGTADQLLDLVRKHVEDLGFIGIKMYPALGFYPYDPRLIKVYDYAQDIQLPVMTHCTKSGVFFKGQLTREHLRPLNMNSNPCKKDYVTERKNAIFKNNFSHPDNYKDVLDLFPDLKLCIAHYGGSSQMLKARGNDGDMKNWYNIIRYLVEGKHQSQFYNTVINAEEPELRREFAKVCGNVFTDVSYSLAEKKVFDLVKQNFDHPVVGKKILFGTDYYMTVIEKPEEKLVYDFYKAFREVSFRGMALSEMLDENAVRYLNSKVYKA